MASQARKIPGPFHAVTPALVVRDAVGAIAFYKQAFGATELMPPLLDPSGKIAHAEILIGDSPLMLSDENRDWGSLSPQTVGGTPVVLAFYVEDADAVVRRAAAAGAKVLMSVKDQFYGDRSGRIEDPYGHIWLVGTHVEDVSPAEVQRRWDQIRKQM